VPVFASPGSPNVVPVLGLVPASTGSTATFTGVLLVFAILTCCVISWPGFAWSR
jgi:hypothetical protein